MQAKAQLQRSWIKLLELQKLQLLVQSVLWSADKPEPGVALWVKLVSDVGAERRSPYVLGSIQPGLRTEECRVSSVSCKTESTEASSLGGSVGKQEPKCNRLTPSGERNPRFNHLKHKRDQVFSPPFYKESSGMGEGTQ